MLSWRCDLYEDLFDLIAFIQEYGYVPLNTCRVLNNFRKVYSNIPTVNAGII